MQEKLEASKKQYKDDKAQIEEIRLKDPELYRKKSAVIEKVKEQIENRISKLN